MAQAVLAAMPGADVLIKVPQTTVDHFAWATYTPSAREDRRLGSRIIRMHSSVP